ncbi:M48 family metallopeptidase [Allomuricauda sp. SCSIO 65647]|uniref:M48 family metallopeptidase n=1 Tax=Allomuricauda sp. SCSIO 65647 TaxID=2908843 RepID=UPI001F45BE21|nr:M48 family metallopeptidase [Muricauda sp. SCSIO 65647]UJH67914.1 M48 family metallopeptidase [Muricauda sp. SCSIO 65647]
MDKSFLFWAIIAILVVQFLIEFLLEYLNAKKFDEPIPLELNDVFDQEEYTKAQAYKKVNYRFGLISDTFALIATLLFLLLGGFEWVDQLVRAIANGPILMALLFFGIIFLANSLISIPFSYYNTFVIEERFGFNKTTRKLFFIDLLKGWVLTAIIGGPLLALVIWFIEKTGDGFWLYAWGLISVFMLFINLFYSRLIVPLFNKQTPLEDGSLKNSIENYARKVGFELKNIFVIDGSKRSTKANAYFSGLGKEKRVTLYDTLIHDLNEDEIVAVLAHEVGHYKRNHIIYNLLSSVTLTGLTLYILSIFINTPEMSFAIGVSLPSYHAAFIGFALLYSPISQLTGLIMNHLSRKFEFQADDYAKNTYAANPLVTSLKKLSKNNLSNLNPHSAYVFVHYSHPPLKERIRNLRA